MFKFQPTLSQQLCQLFKVSKLAVIKENATSRHMEIQNIISAFLPNPQKADLSVPAISKHSLHNTHQEQSAA